MTDRRWTDADREMVARAVHDHACMGDDCSWSEEPRACDLTEFAGFGEAVLDALTAAGWRREADVREQLAQAIEHDAAISALGQYAAGAAQHCANIARAHRTPPEPADGC